MVASLLSFILEELGVLMFIVCLLKLVETPAFNGFIFIFGFVFTTDKEYRFTPGSEWYDTELDHIDYRLSSIDSYMILTYFRYTLENGDWGSFELLTIKLS